MIAITGASGQLGRATIRQLLKKFVPTEIIAIVRNPKSIEEFSQKGIIVRQADYNNYEALLKAFKGVNKALQISTIGVGIETAQKQEKNVVEAMRVNGVEHIIYTSMVQANPKAIFQGTATQYNTEELIRETKIPYTIFRNSMYMEAIPELIGDAIETNAICYPSGDGRVSFVSRNDIAEALANALSDNEHKNKIYEITGEKAYTFSELAKFINPKIYHHDIEASAYKDVLINYQLPIEVVDLLISMANGIRAGEFSHTSDDLRRLLGREALSLPEYLKTI